MSLPSTQSEARALNQSATTNVEASYDRLRDLAREEARKRNECFDKAHAAYERGDGAGAKQLSKQGKEHGRQMDDYNRQASEFIFRENNAPGRVAEDEIDLHGQFVEEAEDILEKYIKAATSRGDTHLHVIVGKGNHSTGNMQKIKPMVEKMCRELGLRYRTEENKGRIFIDFGFNSVSGTGGWPHHRPQHQPHRPSSQHHDESDDPIKICMKCCTVM